MATPPKHTVLSEADFRAQSDVLASSSMNRDACRIHAMAEKMIEAIDEFFNKYDEVEADRLLKDAGLPPPCGHHARWSGSLVHDIYGMRWPLEMFESILSSNCYQGDADAETDGEEDEADAPAVVATAS